MKDLYKPCLSKWRKKNLSCSIQTFCRQWRRNLQQWVTLHSTVGVSKSIADVNVSTEVVHEIHFKTLLHYCNLIFGHICCRTDLSKCSWVKVWEKWILKESKRFLQVVLYSWSTRNKWMYLILWIILEKHNWNTCTVKGLCNSKVCELSSRGKFAGILLKCSPHKRGFEMILQGGKCLHGQYFFFFNQLVSLKIERLLCKSSSPSDLFPFWIKHVASLRESYLVHYSWNSFKPRKYS